MPKIHVLPQQVAEMIAAGEVIDRPASIVKELVENALDAGATRITAEIENGGIGYLRVTDNGCGIAREDLANAFVRHATSKVRTAQDLDAIGTLGFRGEALPSIAAVSHVKVMTRTEEETVGSVLTIDGGRAGAVEEAGCPVGTTFEVRDVFYNTPARMKFLKKDVTEANAIATLLDRLALANPGVAFELIRDGKRTLRTPGDGDLLAAIRVVCGADVAAQMIPVRAQAGGIAVQGYISRPTTSRTSRTLQIFFINTRYVRSHTCAAAVEDAYKNRLMVGRFPACVLNLSIDTALVDVNVHPAKLEVRFSSERDVYNAVHLACAQALAEAQRAPAPSRPKLTPFSLDDFDYSGQQTRIGAPPVPKTPTDLPRPALSPLEQPATALHAGETPAFPRPTAPVMTQPVYPRPTASVDIEVTEPRRFDASDPRPARIEPPPDEPVCAPQEPEWRIIGELFDTYLLIQQGEQFHLIDKHAAHERWNYNRLRHLGETPSERQVLLAPQAVTLPREEYFALLENPEVLQAIGIAAEDFGEGTLLVREIPMLLDGCPLGDILSEAAEKAMLHRRNLTPSVLDELLYSVSCRASVMAGKESSMPERAALAEMVLGEEQIRFCPHGRPALVTLTRRDVEKLFGRLG